MGRKVKCKICKTQIDTDNAYCITKVNETSGKKTNSYYCSEEEYLKNKEEKELWKKLLVAVDDILGYTCISKTKVNMIKEIEENYSRKQLYNCLVNNADEIKRYLNEKNIFEEYGKLSYIFACVKNKIRDDSNNISIDTSLGASTSEYEEETEEELEKRIKKMKEKRNTSNSILDIIKSFDKNNKK